MIRPLTSLADCRRVVELEKEVWAYTDAEDVVPVPLLVVTTGRGAILLGAFDTDGEMKGFVYSIPGWKGRQPIQWSHMLGVRSDARGRGVAARLKSAQRHRALEQGFECIEWTYDPLQAPNAHLNFAKLGVLVEDYEENVYGESSSPLHRGTPTDRFLAQWHLRDAEVERRVAAQGPRGSRTAPADVALVNPSIDRGEWLVPGRADLTVDAPVIRVEIPEGFSDMQQREPALALDWRMATREVFQSYFRHGYRAIDFFLDRAHKRGAYLLRA